MNRVVISGWELNLPSIKNFNILLKQLISKKSIKSEKYFKEDYLSDYFKFKLNPSVIKYKNNKNSLLRILKKLIDNSIRNANLSQEKLRHSRIKIYLTGQGPRADFIHYQGFYDKNDAEDVSYSPNIKYLHSKYYAQDELSKKLFEEYLLDYPPIPLYCASNSALMGVHIGHKEISQGMADIVIVLSWNSLVMQDIAFMESQNMLVDEYAQPFSKQSDGVVLSEGYCAIILENDEYIKERAHLFSAYISHSIFIQSNAERVMGGALFSFHTISKVILQILAKANLSPTDIGAIFIHGNGSIISDKAEAIAISTIFKENINVPIISYKGQIGYISNCSGIIDLMIMSHSLKYKELIPSITHYPINDSMDLNFLSNKNAVKYDNKPMLKIGLGMDGSIIAMILMANELLLL